ncbi:hypothetical protein [Paraburkholderia kururiensis]|uniref:hypothetical protein n=1 Tax=Paraburkholderia kururiensis TaxID=984307 RepID=UPI0018F62F9D|nr:hypothetical protein [Paraburkholderia kururiensis]
MNTDNWPPCIVTAFDLVGTRNLAASGKGSSAMVTMQGRAVAKINHGLPLHSHGYIWNDSVLLLSYMTEQNWSRRGFFAELDDFRSFLQRACGASIYAISVKGLAFPHNTFAPAVFDGQIAQQPRAVVLKTSSWAMANCFLIEKLLGHHRADWYIDSRISDGADLPVPFASDTIELLPKKESRRIDMFKGNIRPID